MGLLTTYIAYRYGRRKADARLEAALDDYPRLDEICASCGHEFRFHADDAIATCPIELDLDLEFPESI